jgi:myo-inositol-1(or 4)-monophosphatase
MSERADCALRAAEAGGAVAAGSFREAIAVETKADKTDVVTQADHDAQASVVATIREEYPEDAIVGEEDEELREVPDVGPAWIIDPIDGTNNYVRGIQSWTTSVAATVDGEAVAGATVCPALEDTYLLDEGVAYRNGEELSVSDRTDPEAFTVVPTVWWPRDRRAEYSAICRGIVERFGDMRRFGSAQLELALCAAGAIEGVVTNVEAKPWDSVVGAGLVEAAGGTVTDIHGEPWRHDSRGLVASNGEAHDLVLEAAREAEAEADADLKR